MQKPEITKNLCEREREKKKKRMMYIYMQIVVENV